MPASYTHYAFGQAVLHKLPLPLKQIIQNNPAYYNLGTIGPDLFFYHLPFLPARVFHLGLQMHRQPAQDFFVQAREVIITEKSPALFSYVSGFITHFMLDSSAHPYIKRKMKYSRIAHQAIETEFDRLLMLKDGLNPLQESPVDHLEINYHLAENLALILPELTAKQIYRSVTALKFYSSLLICSSDSKRKFLQQCLKMFGLYKAYSPLIMTEQPNSCCYDSNQQLLLIFEAVIPETVALIQDYARTFLNRSKINQRFYRNYQ